MMKPEGSISFTTPMMSALLENRKTQTRRLITPQPATDEDAAGRAPRFLKNGLYYVKEMIEAWEPGAGGVKYVRYRADRKTTFLPWPAEWKRDYAVAMHMPRAVARRAIRVTDVVAERIQDITEDEAIAEGVVYVEGRGFMVPGVEHDNKDFPYLSRVTAREMYAALIDTIHGSCTWGRNPWVFKITFEQERIVR